LPKLIKLRCQGTLELRYTIADKSTGSLQRKTARAAQTTGRNALD